MPLYFNSKLCKLLECSDEDQFSVLFEVRFTGEGERTSAAVLRQYIAYLVKLLRRTGRLVNHQLITAACRVFIKSVFSCKETAQPMSCGNDVVKLLENVKTGQIDCLFSSRRFRGRCSGLFLLLGCRPLSGLAELLENIDNIVSAVKLDGVLPAALIR